MSFWPNSVTLFSHSLFHGRVFNYIQFCTLPHDTVLHQTHNLYKIFNDRERKENCNLMPDTVLGFYICFHIYFSQNSMKQVSPFTEIRKLRARNVKSFEHSHSKKGRDTKCDSVYGNPVLSPYLIHCPLQAECTRAAALVLNHQATATQQILL